MKRHPQEMPSLRRTTDRPRSYQAEVFVANSFSEYEALQAQGVVVEMLILDPVFRVC